MNAIIKDVLDAAEAVVDKRTGSIAGLKRTVRAMRYARRQAPARCDQGFCPVYLIGIGTVQCQHADNCQYMPKEKPME